MNNKRKSSTSFIYIFNESVMTLLSFFSISLVGLVFGNIASYLQAIIILRDENIIKSILGAFLIISACIVYFIQSDDKGYKLEVGLKFNTKQILCGTGIAALLYAMICILGLFYYQGKASNVPMLIKMLFYPGFAVNQSLDMLFNIEIDLFICSVILLPIFIAIRLIALFRGRSIVLNQRQELHYLAQEYRSNEKKKNSK